MLPAPEKIMLATLYPTAAAGCNFLGIQLHFAPWLLKKGRNTQERILHFSSDQLNYSLHAKPPHHLTLRYCRAFAATMNDRLIL